VGQFELWRTLMGTRVPSRTYGVAGQLVIDEKMPSPRWLHRNVEVTYE
jgi:hypothetical protein